MLCEPNLNIGSVNCLHFHKRTDLWECEMHEINDVSFLTLFIMKTGSAQTTNFSGKIPQPQIQAPSNGISEKGRDTALSTPKLTERTH
jgi:hypothetical protein